MNIQQRKLLESAFDIIALIREEQEDKQCNLEDTDMEHLPIYEKIEEEVSALEEIEALITELQEVV